MPARTADRSILADFCDHPVRALSGQKKGGSPVSGSSFASDISSPAVRPLAPLPKVKAGRAVLPCRLGMARARPTPEDAATARRILLGGLARDARVFELLGELEPLHPRNGTFPGEVLLHLAAGALGWCRASRAGPLPLAGLPARFLPELSLRGRQHNKLQYAVLAAAARHGGTEPDLLEEVAWGQTDDLWEYALYAAVAYIRAAARHACVPVRQACQDLAPGMGNPAP